MKHHYRLQQSHLTPSSRKIYESILLNHKQTLVVRTCFENLVDGSNLMEQSVFAPPIEPIQHKLEVKILFLFAPFIDSPPKQAS